MLAPAVQLDILPGMNPSIWHRHITTALEYDIHPDFRLVHTIIIKP